MAFAWNADVRKAVIASYYRSQRRIGGGFHYDAAQCKRDLVAQYPALQNVRTNSLNKQIKRIVNFFQENGSIENPKRRYAPPKLNEGKIEEIRQAVQDSGGKESLRKIAAQVNVSHKSVHTALRKNLQLKPYKITRYHKIEDGDPEQRMMFCNWFVNNINDEDLDFVFFSDEAWVHLDGYVNSQNCRVWGSENPHEFVSIGTFSFLS